MIPQLFHSSNFCSLFAKPGNPVLHLTKPMEIMFLGWFWLTWWLISKAHSLVICHLLPLSLFHPVRVAVTPFFVTDKRGSPPATGGEGHPSPMLRHPPPHATPSRVLDRHPFPPRRHLRTTCSGQPSRRSRTQSRRHCVSQAHSQGHHLNAHRRHHPYSVEVAMMLCSSDYVTQPLWVEA